MTFEKWLVGNQPTALDKVSIQFNRSGRDANQRRGLVAQRSIPIGGIAASIPMNSIGLSIESLSRSLGLRGAEAKQYFLPPFDLSSIMKFLCSRGIADPALYPQVFFALLLAAERMQPDSVFRPYLDLLPHPAMDDLAVMRLHKDMLDPTQLLEWDAHQHEFSSIAKLLHRQWIFSLTQGHPSASVERCVPPVQVLYWAIRTVLSRHFQLPRGGVLPQDVGSKLDLYTFDTINALNSGSGRVSQLFRKIREAVMPSSSSSSSAASKFELEPMLVPLIDFVGHVSPANVSLDVATRPGLGPCVELKAIDTIKEGDEIGSPYNSSHSVAFTLYRFGFLPV